MLLVKVYRQVMGLAIKESFQCQSSFPIFTNFDHDVTKKSMSKSRNQLKYEKLFRMVVNS